MANSLKKCYILTMVIILLLEPITFRTAFAEESVVLQQGESIQVTGSASINVSWKHDYAIYDQIGAVDYGSRYSGHTINEQQRIVIENDNEDELTITISSGAFERIEQPALKKLNVKSGESWAYTGGSDFVIPEYFEFVNYQEDGKAKDYESSEWYERMKTLSSETIRKVITFKEDQEVYGAYETFKDPTKVTEPALLKISVKAGETWEYTGGSDFRVPNYYEYVDYREDGTAFRYDDSRWSDRMTTLPDDYTRKVFTFLNDQEVYGPYEIFRKPKEITEPALRRVKVKAGENWEYSGGSDFTIPSEYEYVDYQEDGKAKGYNDSAWWDRITELPDQAERKVITFPKEQEVYGPYETFKEPIRSSEPALKKVQVKSGETMEYAGGSDFTIPDYFEYANYRDDGTASGYSDYGWRDRINSLSTEDVRKVMTFLNDQEIYGPYQTFKEPEKISEPALKKVNVKAGESWEYTGGSDFKIPSYFDYVNYKEDGTARSYSDFGYSDRITALSTEDVRKVITFQREQVVYGPYETFIVPEKISEPALRRINVTAGESWEYYGESDFMIPSYYEYVNYKADGTASGYDNSTLYDRITNLSTEDVRKVITFQRDQVIHGPHESFRTPVRIEEPALDYLTLEPNESIKLETPGIDFNTWDRHFYQWYKGTDIIDSGERYYKRYRIEENDLMIKNTDEEDSITLYGPYEVFPTLRPREDLHVKYNNGALSKLKVGNLTITGQVEQDAANDKLYTVTGDISLNDFLKYRGELRVDKGQYTVSGNGLLYVPVNESKHFYAGQIPLYKGQFNIDAKTVNLIPGEGGISLLAYEKLPIEINSVTIAPKGVNIGGAIDFSPAFGGRVETSVQIDELSVRTDGMDLQGTFNLPDFRLGGLEITKPYVNLNTKAHAFGGGGEVGKIGKMIVPAGGSLSGDFNFYNGLLNRVAIQSVFPRPIPIGTTPFGLSGIGGGVDNIQGANKDDGTTIFVNADLSDTFSPTIDGGHLIMGDNLQLEASNLHIASSGSLKMYSLQLGKTRSEWHTKKGFKANGSMDIFDTYVADYSLKVPKVKPFNGSASGKLKVPDDIWFIGGTTFNGIRGEVDPSKVMVSATLIGIDVGVAYDFDKDDIKFKVSELEEGVQTQEIKDDVVVTYGTNMRAKGNYSSTSVMSAQSNGLGVSIPIESPEEAALMEVTWSGAKPELTILSPDGAEYPLILSGDQANYLQEGSSAFISVQNPETGTWEIRTDTEGTSDLSVQLVSVQQKPKVNSAALDLEGETPVLKWDVTGAEDTKVSIYISDSKDSYSGELLRENLPLTGEEAIELPETLISGKHYIFVKAEREDIGTDWMYADQAVDYVDPLSPEVPGGVTEEGVNNGQIKLKWEEVEGAAGYVVAPLDEHNQVDHSRSLQVENGVTTAVINGWETDKNYKLVVMSYKEASPGELNYSLPSEPIEVFLPEASPPIIDLEWKAEAGKIVEQEIEINDSIKTLRVNNSDMIELTGNLDQEAVTQVMVNGEEVASIQGNTFTQQIQLEEGPNEITIRSVNAAGDETIQSYDCLVDSVDPTLYVETPFDQAILTTTDILVKGNTEIGSTVMVNNQPVVVDEEGNFTYEFSVEEKETETIVVSATDFAGNITKYEAQVQIKIPEEKTDVTGFLIRGEETLSGITFSVHSVTGDETWYDTTTNDSGRFTLDLPDGEYQVDGIWIEVEQKWFILNQQFSVENGILKDQEELVIHLEDDPVNSDENIMGQILVEGQSLNEGLTFSIHTTDAESEWYDVHTDESGNFKFYLPDGEYQVDGVWMESEQKWYVLNRVFTVSSGKLVGSESLIIDINEVEPPPAEGVSGRVETDSAGVGNVLFSLHTTGENQQWYDVQTDENGDFQLILPDGEYQIDGIWVETEQKWYPLNQLFTVVNGQLEGESGLLIDLMGDREQQGSVEGTVTKGSVAIPDVLFSLHTTDDNPVWRDIQTDENGRFIALLLDGEYQIDGIWIQSESKWYPLNQVFTVENGQLSGAVELTVDVLNEVIPSEGPIKGKVTKSMTALGNVPFSLHATDSSPVWYDTYADENGNFTLTLPNGEYQIDGIWLESEQTWYPLNQVFRVEKGLLVGSEEIVIDVLGELNQPAEALTGKVVNGEQDVSDVIFSIHTREENPAWYDIQTNESGEFTLNLSDGEYQIDGIWIESESAWYVLNLQFTIENGRLKDLENLIIDLAESD